MKPPENPFPIVGIGASAGGLRALTSLFDALPAAPGFAVVVIQHLDPLHESRLPELIQAHTQMEVGSAVHNAKLLPNCVYVITPNTSVAIADGVLSVTARPSGSAPHYPVDLFFRSLAVVQENLAVGVILSGTGSDGTLGAIEIKAHGGVTMAQDEKTSEFFQMPQSALAAGAVDLVHSPKEIAEKLVTLTKTGLPPSSPQELDPGSAGGFKRVITALRQTSGVDFSQYRDTTIYRRTSRRMLLKGISSPAQYADLVERDPSEAEALYRDVLINVTSFFRDPQVFEDLKEVAFPKMFHDRAEGLPIRVWVPGCSTGQEAYSLAIALTEFNDAVKGKRALQIFATDLADLPLLERARAGLYPHSIESEVSAERLERFFVKEEHGYRVSKVLRDCCVFARQNMAVDPPFSRVDLISCRNVLIYMSSPLQSRIVPILHFALNPGGFLLLGGAETIGSFTDLFEIVDRKDRVYRRKEGARKAGLAFMSEHWLVHAPRRQAQDARPFDPLAEAQRQAFLRYVPPAVVVDSNFDIQNFHGRTSLFLESPAGQPTSSLLRMIKGELLAEVHTALEEAKASRVTVVREGLSVAAGSQTLKFTLRVSPLSISQPNEVGAYSVFFEPQELPAWLMDNGREGQGSAAPPEVSALKQELATSKHYLQSIVDQQAASAQELRAAHEEVLSSNEELQSTNEELETTKEELQSTNEELTTLNEQFQSRNRELDTLTDDLENFLASAELPMVTVGRDLRIRRLTPAAETAFNLLPTDVGRSIEHINFSLRVGAVGALVRKVVETLQPLAMDVQDEEDRWWVVRVQPYRTRDNRMDGVTIVAMDIDSVKRGQEIREARDHALSIIEAVAEPMVVLDDKCAVGLANDAFYELFPDAERLMPGRLLWETGHPAWSDTALLKMVRKACHDRVPLMNQEIEVALAGKGDRILVVNVRRVQRENRPVSFLVSLMDITEQRQAERLRMDAEKLRLVDRKKDQFLGILAHELRNPLAPMRFALEALQKPGIGAEDAARSRQVLMRQMTHLVRLVDDLLDVSRINQGKVNLKYEILDLQTIVKNAVELSEPALIAAGHTLSVSLPDEVIRVKGDEIRMTQMISNLLNNAGKFTPSGGHVWLIAEKAGNDVLHPDQLKIRVRDTGIGIDPADLDRIFEMFQQGDQTIERSRGGLGVGLTLVRNLATLHGGAIDVSSEGRDRGAEFTLTFPLDPELQQATPSGGTPRATKPARSRRILVAEDNADGREMLELLLRTDGHTVIGVSNGLEAVEKAKTFRPDIAIMDLGMPVLNGFAAAERFQSDPDLRPITLVALSGLGRDEDASRALAAGFRKHLRKPIEVDALRRFLDQEPVEAT